MLTLIGPARCGKSLMVRANCTVLLSPASRWILVKPRSSRIASPAAPLPPTYSCTTSSPARDAGAHGSAGCRPLGLEIGVLEARITHAAAEAKQRLAGEVSIRSALHR